MTISILASEYVTDTVGLVLYLEKRRLGSDAQQIFDATENGKTIVHIPSMVVAEILYLSEKSRISLTVQDVKLHLKTFPYFRECPMTHAIIETAEKINDIPELHDRLIAATAKHLNLELLTNDTKIQSSAFVNTVW